MIEALKNLMRCAFSKSPYELAVRQCQTFGHMEFGSYYGMPQSHCRRCGQKTRYADPKLNLPEIDPDIVELYNLEQQEAEEVISANYQ